MKRFIKHTAMAAMLAGGLTLSSVAHADDHSLSEKVAAGDYKMDTSHGYVTFTYSHFGLSNPQISFKGVGANITLDTETPATAL